MKDWFKLQPHPFKLLLYLEWILLGLTTFKIFGLPFWLKPQLMNGADFLVQTEIKPIEAIEIASVLLLFGTLGLWLPTTRVGKWIYTLLSFALIAMLGSLQGWSLESISPLSIVMVLRGCLLFERRGRWLVAGLMWLVHPLTIAPILLVIWVLLHPAIRAQIKAEPIPGITYLPDGAVQLSYNFSAQSVEKFLNLAQNATLYLIAESFLSFGLIVLFVMLLVNSVVNEREGRRKLALAHAQLYEYSLQIEDRATLQERTRIAREVHDTLGHLLTAQSVVLENTALSIDRDPQSTRGFLDESKRLGKQARQELRQAISMLRADPLQGQTLTAAIETLVDEFSQISGIHPQLQIHLPISIPDRYQVAVYRILAEALTNIQKHSAATQVEIKLEIRSPAATSPVLELEINDNGLGFDPSQNQTGFGLQGMQERAESLGGRVQIHSETGCQIAVSLPLLGAQ
jgi:signal transduction histidine kinase